VQTIILSDLHLTEAHEPTPRRPHWIAYKHRAHYIDGDFERLVEHVAEQAEGPVELILNGDIFDFDAVVQVPSAPEGKVDWLARLRGLASEEWMSRFKMEVIVRDHPLWFAALRRFLARGHRVVFVLGNHDLELAWPSVQRVVLDALGLGGGGADAESDQVVFCNWFYLSNGDTYVSHGHQYDENCVGNPIDPLIEVHGRPRVRIPFGDLAGRYMLNGMGYFNPNAKDNYIMSAWQYLRFFLRYMLVTQPLLLWTWFWGALVTAFIALTEHWRPPMRDPLRVEEKVTDIARRSAATPSMVRQLQALDVPSACTRPLAIVRELWLDRGLLILGMLYASWQMFLIVHAALPISPAWLLVPLGLLIPPYIVYASRVKSTVFDKPLLDERRAELIHRITGATTVVFGHTHEPLNHEVGPVRHLNAGFWSAAFAEPECTRRIGTQTFVWISAERTAQLYEWAPGAALPRPYAPPVAQPATNPAAKPAIAPLGVAAAPIVE
jgi:UDP-2,3-diacylglucosamine pyrophosphatase LpxH